MEWKKALMRDVEERLAKEGTISLSMNPGYLTFHFGDGYGALAELLRCHAILEAAGDLQSGVDLHSDTLLGDIVALHCRAMHPNRDRQNLEDWATAFEKAAVGIRAYVARGKFDPYGDQ